MANRTRNATSRLRDSGAALAALLLLCAGLFSGCSDHAFKAIGEDDDELVAEGELQGQDSDPEGQDSGDEDGLDNEDPIDEDEDDSQDPEDPPPGDDDDDVDDEPGSDPGNPRPLIPGDLVINELMIDPVEVGDALGEYVELRNNGGAWVEFGGLRLGDWGVDDAPVLPLESGPILLGPGAFYVICTEADFWDNGGVECDATIEYSTWGDGFALSNTEDEVVLSASNGVDLDVVVYDEEVVEPGEATGVDPDYSSVSGNNDLDEWCTQFGLLPFGDSGSPGESNSNCW